MGKIGSRATKKWKSKKFFTNPRHNKDTPREQSIHYPESCGDVD